MPVNFYDFKQWAEKRETLYPADASFWAWNDAYEKAELLLKGLEIYFMPEAYRILLYNLALHYCITTDFIFNQQRNPLYEKYGIDEKGKGMVASASDVNSSASMVVTNAMQELDFIGQDLISTPYGKYAYSILASVNITPVAL